jgi:hypothetical protein
MVSKAIVISLTALGISIGGAALTFLIHYIYTDIYDVSPINIVIERGKDDLSTITKITHNGKELISGLHFTLRTPKEITSCSYFTSVKDMTLETLDNIPCSEFTSVKDMTSFSMLADPDSERIASKSNIDKIHPPNVLTGAVPKFEPGPGSVIEIYTNTTSGAKTIYIGGYSAHAVYDKGSVKRELPLPWWEEISNQFHRLDLTVRKSILIGIIITVLSFIAWLITRFFDSLKVIYRDARRKLK